MCNQVQSVTLQTAVLMQVKEFAQNNTPFSVHDITTAIRNKTAQGELEVPEVEVQGASFRFDVRHVKVKALFDELWRTGVFDPDFTITRSPQLVNNQYFLYTPSPINGGVAVVGISVAPQAPLTAGVPVSAPSVPTASIFRPSRKEIMTRASIYLSNCAARNFRPSLKQVQSAIKRGDASTGWSCEELQNLIETDLGYTVVDNPDNVSKAQVATV